MKRVEFQSGEFIRIIDQVVKSYGRHVSMLSVLGLFISPAVRAMEGSWDFAADPYAKNKTGFYADQENIHIEAEVFDYNQDLTTQKEGLGYFRSDFLVDMADESSFEVEILGNRANAYNTDADNFTGYIRHLNPLTTIDAFTVSFLSQVILPMNRSSFEEEESTKPVIGIDLGFYESERFSANLTLSLSNSSDLEFQQWKKSYITSFYMEWSLTERLSSVVDLYFEREQGVAAVGYKWIIASLNYEVSENLNVNLGTRTVGDQDAATNTMLGGTYIF